MTRNSSLCRFPILFLFICASCTTSHGPEAQPLRLKSFRSDLCTFFPNHSQDKKDSWAHCCFIHDLDYWSGGLEDSRERSDQNLKSCVQESSAQTHADEVMFLGVKLAGGPELPLKKTSWSWGYGWNTKSRYHSHRTSEKRMIAQKLESVLKEYQEKRSAFSSKQRSYIQSKLLKKVEDYSSFMNQEKRDQLRKKIMALH